MFKVALLSAWHVHAEEYLTTLDKLEGAEIAVVWDNDEERGKALAEKYNKPFEPNLEKIWKDRDINGVIVTTATSIHKEIIIAAAKSGKHIFTEKVLAATVDEAEEIRAAVKESGVKFCISFPHRTSAGNLYAKKAIDSKVIGDVTFLRVRNAHNGAIGNWLPSRFYDEKEACGGAMLDLGAHPMYLIRWFLGCPKNVVSMYTDYTGHGTDDNSVSVFGYENGAVAVSETGFVTAFSPYFIEIYGTEGTILIGGTDNNVKLKTKNDGAKGFTVVDTSEFAGMKNAMTQWFDAVVDGGDTVFDIDQAYELTVMMDAAYRSHRESKKIEFPN